MTILCVDCRKNTNQDCRNVAGRNLSLSCTEYLSAADNNAALDQLEQDHWDQEVAAEIAYSKTPKGMLENIINELKQTMFVLLAARMRDDVLEWWEEHRYDTYLIEDGMDEDNVFNGQPAFVTIAKQLNDMKRR